MTISIEYGCITKRGRVYTPDDTNFMRDYQLQSPEQTYQCKIGVCWDQVELQRVVFQELHIEHITVYFVDHIDDTTRPSHTALLFKKGGGWYWFENSFGPHRGIHGRYRAVLDILHDIKQAMRKHNRYDKTGIFLYSYYDQPPYGISAAEFMRHCEGSDGALLTDLP